MLKYLSYSVTFPSTGRTLAADVAFRPGFGVITGPNESGKSANIEQVRFCLFGSAALRGQGRATLHMLDIDEPSASALAR